MQFAFFRRFGPLSPTGLALAGPKWNMPWYLGSIAPEGADAQLPRVTPSSRASSCVLLQSHPASPLTPGCLLDSCGLRSWLPTPGALLVAEAWGSSFSGR